MGAFFSISFWIALATVIPGFIAAGVLYLCIAAAGLDIAFPESDWAALGILIGIMVLTQAFGILLEEVLVRFRLLGTPEQTFFVPDPARTGDVLRVAIEPYEQYRVVYGLLVQLGKDEDPHGHLERALVQFFLTNNSLVAFGGGALMAFALALGATPAQGSSGLVLIGLGCLVCLAVSYRVAAIRFRVVAESVWALRKLRTLPQARTRAHTTDSRPQPESD